MKDFLHHWILPRHSNNHRPRVLHLEIMFLIVAILFSGLMTISDAQKQYPSVLGISTNISIQDLLLNTNMQRKANGLAPLQLNDKLTKAAEMKAHHMFQYNYWAHVAPDGTTPWVFIKDAGYNYLYAGENLARGFTTSEDVVNAWMNSPTHRENLLSPNYTDIGFAVQSGSLTGADTILVVQEFGSPYESKPDEQAVVPSGFGPGETTPIPLSAKLVTPTPTAGPIAVAQNNTQKPDTFTGVASIQNKPLIDIGTIKKNTSFIILGFFIFVLLLDAVIIERKKIARAFSHNLDHVLFLLFILLAGIIIGGGAIL